MDFGVEMKLAVAQLVFDPGDDSVDFFRGHFQHARRDAKSVRFDGFIKR
jgi:hypothetical protein